MKARRIISLILALVLCVMTFAACGKKANDKDEQGRTIIYTDEYPDKEGKDKDNYDAKVAKFTASSVSAVCVPPAKTVAPSRVQNSVIGM